MFAIPLTDDDIYTGTIDLVLREKSTGRVWFADYKTTTSIDRYDKASDMDRQISRYWWALQQLASGLGQVFNQKNNTWDSIFNSRLFDDLTAPYGFFYNIILKSYPVAPKTVRMIKKNSEITRRNPIYRNITHDCSWDCPFLTICEASLDGSDIEWMIEQEFIKEEPK
jgi:hypothetical protein